MKALMGRRSVVSLLLAGALLAVVGGVAWAAIPGPGGVIQGCYDGGGNLKVVEQLPARRETSPLPGTRQGRRRHLRARTSRRRSLRINWVATTLCQGRECLRLSRATI